MTAWHHLLPTFPFSLLFISRLSLTLHRYCMFGGIWIPQSSPTALSSFLSAPCHPCSLNDRIQHCQGDVILRAQWSRAKEKSLDHHFPSSQSSKGRWTRAGLMKYPSLSTPKQRPAMQLKLQSFDGIKTGRYVPVCTLSRCVCVFLCYPCLSTTVCWNHAKHVGVVAGWAWVTRCSVSGVSACERSCWGLPGSTEVGKQ